MVGRARPDMYSADLSLFVLDAGLRLLASGAARLLYLSLSDYVQHGHAPGEPEADAFHRALDERVARFVELGAVVGLVADHGMNDKPRVIFLEDELTRRFGAGAARVICPITDPFVRHHGALGSFVRVYARDGADIAAMMTASAALPGVAGVFDRAEAARPLRIALRSRSRFCRARRRRDRDRRRPRRARFVGARRPSPALAWRRRASSACRSSCRGH